MNPDQALTICVQLWSKPGQDEALIAYEDQVLARIPDHGGQVLQRVRRAESGDAALEVHVISMPSQTALQNYLDDPVRAALSQQRDAAIDRTLMTMVTIVE